MLTLQTVGSGKASENISEVTEGGISETDSTENTDVKSEADTLSNPTAEPAAKKAPLLKKENINNVGDFLKSFIKQPVQTVQSGALGFVESLIIIAAQAIGLGLLMFILTFRVGRISGLNMFGFSAFSFPERLGVLFLGLICALILSVVLSALIIFLGKVIYKGKFEGKADFPKLLSYIAASEIPLTVSLVVAVVLSIFTPLWIVSIVLAFGCVSAIAFAPTVFKSVFDITDDQSVYGAMFAYAMQVSAVVGLLSQIGDGVIRVLI